VLGLQPVAVTLPRIYYCTTQPRAWPVPPPPAASVLRFADAPDEEYVVWRSHNRADYAVERRGERVSKDLAGWSLQIGAFERSPDETGQPPLWRLAIRAVRQPLWSPLDEPGRVPTVLDQAPGASDDRVSRATKRGPMA
jgi:hypothetical protein